MKQVDDTLNFKDYGKPTPSKEPSVDELLHNFSVTYPVVLKEHRKQSLAEAKSQLLALHLGCLPEKVEEYPQDGQAQYGQRVGYNRALIDVEQKLREMYGKT